jgi:hypothetical protein
MYRHRRLEVLEAKLTPVQLSELWLRRIREFDRVEEYVAWFSDDIASGAARRAFLLQARTVILRNKTANADMRSSGSAGCRRAISQIASRWFQFWICNEIHSACRLCLGGQITHLSGPPRGTSWPTCKGPFARYLGTKGSAGPFFTPSGSTTAQAVGQQAQ